MKDLLSGIVLLAVISICSFLYGEHRARTEIETADKQALKDANDYSAKLEGELKEAKGKIEVRTEYRVKEVPKYVTRYIPVPGAASVSRPAYYLTWGSIRLYSDALCDAGRSCGVTENPPGSGPFDLSPYDFGRVEVNAITNLGLYSACRETVKGWQTWYTQSKARIH